MPDDRQTAEARRYYQRKAAELDASLDPSDLDAIRAALGRDLTVHEADHLAHWGPCNRVHIIGGKHRAIRPISVEDLDVPEEVAAARERKARPGAVRDFALAAMTALGGGAAPRVRTHQHDDGRLTYSVVALPPAASVRRRGRACRPATNGRSRGSRRAGTSSRSSGGGSSGDSDDSESSAPAAPVSLLAPFEHPRFGRVGRRTREVLRQIGEWS